MVPANPQEESIIRSALDRPSVERAAFLDGACLGDPEFRLRVEALLRIGLEEGVKGKPTVLEPGLPPALGEDLEEGPGTQIGRYSLLEKIGEGGFGTVYAAEQKEPVRRRVALKIIKLGMDTRQVVARLEAERQALAMMEHPSIAKVLDGGTTAHGRPYIVMELVRGIPITRYCDEQKLDTRERLDLFLQVCQAIQHAHQKGIIHRDIKPSNILITLQSGTAIPKVIDFGVAKAIQQPLSTKTVYTQLQQFVGTPPYMSPEQAEMSVLDIDTRSDIYSLGVLLYELLVGKTPFDGKELLDSGLELMRRTIREKEPLRPSTRLSTMVPAELAITAECRRIEPPKLIGLMRGDLDWIVMKCLEKNRARRYETANGLIHDIQRHLRHEPVSAHHPSAAYKIQKFVRRNQVTVGAAATVLVILIAATAVSLWQAVRATEAERYADLARRNADQNAKRASAESARALAAEKKANEDLADVRRALYDANMNRIQRAWDEHQLNPISKLLEEVSTYPELGFEYYYWQRLCHLELRSLRGHAGKNPDSSGPLVLVGHRDVLLSAIFSPQSGRIFTGSEDHTARLWDLTGDELLCLSGHNAGVCSVAFSPDGQRCLTASADGTARVWDAATGNLLCLLQGHQDSVCSAAFSPDGHTILTGSRDKTVKAWDSTTGKELFTLTGHEEGITSLVFSPDGKWILSGSSDSTVRLWSTDSGEQVQILNGYAGAVTSVAFSADGLRIIAGNEDGTASVWSAVTGKRLLTLVGHNGSVKSVSSSPDNHRFITGGLDGSAKVWDAVTGKELLSLKAHIGGVNSVGFSPDGQQVITAGADKTAKVWESARPP